MCWRVFIKFIPFWILFWIVSVGIFAQNFEQEYKKLKAKPREPGYVELLSRVPITTELWSMMVLNYWDLTGSSPEKLWPCDVIKQNQLLEDDPYDVLRLPIFHALKYEPKWEVFPRPRSEYARKYFLVGNYQKSAEQLEIMEKSEPFNLHLLFSLALLYEHLGDFQAAAQRLRLVRERAADSQTRLLALRWSARLQVRLGNLSMAENLLLKLVSALKRLVGQSLSKKADRSKLFPLEKRLSEVENLLGIVRFQEGKKVLAFNGFLELEKRFPGNFAFVFNKNKIFLETRKYESTLKSTNKALNTLRVLISGFQARMVQEVKSGILVKAGKLADTRSAFERLHSLLLRRKGEILFREKLYPRALKLFEESVRKNPRDDVSYFRMGEIHVELKNLDRALARFRRAAEHAVEGSKIQKEALGWIDKIFAQQAVDAIAEEDPVRKKRDEFFQTLDVDERDEILELGEIISIGQKWLATGEHKKLIRYFRGLLSEHSNVLEVWYLLARAYREMGLSILARFYYGRALEIDPRHIPSLAAKTYYLSIAHRFEETLSVLEFMESFASGNHQLLGAWGWYHYQKSEYQKAVTFYQEAIEKEPQYSEHHYRLGMVYFQTRLYRFALHKFQDAQTAGYPWSRASLFRGVSHLYLGEVVKGEEALRKAVQYGKDNPDIQNFARDILKGLRESQRFEIGMMPDLGKYLERSFPRFKTRSVTQSSLRNSLDEIRSGRTFQVAERLRNRLQQDPENLELMHVLGYLHLLLDREDLAAEYFSSALDRNPLDYRAMNSLSEIEFRRGRIDECVLYWEKMKKVSALIDYSTLLKEFSEDFLKRFEFNPADEWAIYQYALLKLHTHKEEDALDILEQITPTFQDRKSPFSDRLLVLHGQVLFKLGILQEKEEWINMGRGLLSRAGYRYLDLIDRYKRGAVVLEPPRKIPYKVRPAPKAQLDFLKLQRTLEVARTEPLQAIPLR
ncbi:tetratricopeptide repeat protein, partial [bacterium]|nr:tetratricopeptide repeat protein [bacterium]